LTPHTPAAAARDPSYRGVVYPWHCDQNGHMNVMWYVGKFDEASWGFLARLGLTPSYFRESGRGVVALRQELDYRRELFAGDVIEVVTDVAEVSEKSLRFTHHMRHADGGEAVAICALLTVHIDRVTRRAAPMPQHVLARARAATLATNAS